jgi:SAM-dependent methyltransferase
MSARRTRRSAPGKTPADAHTAAPERVVWAVEQLAIDPKDRLLEIGCGSGYAVALVCRQLGRGTITAIDRSALQVRRARERNQRDIAAGRARIEQLSLANTAEELGQLSFDKVFAINVNAFWTQPAASNLHLARLLRPSSLAYLIYEPPSAARLKELQKILPEQLQKHGLQVIAVRQASFRASQALCLVARTQR